MLKEVYGDGLKAQSSKLRVDLYLIFGRGLLQLRPLADKLSQAPPPMILMLIFEPDVNMTLYNIVTPHVTPQ